MKRLISRLLLAAAIGALAACTMNQNSSSADASSAAPAARLSAYHWDLAQARDANGTTPSRWVPPKTLRGAPLRLSFADQRVSVAGLCNRLGASYRTQGDRLEISPMVGTMMACGDAAVMQYEREVSQRLPQAVSWRVTQGADGPTLLLGFGDGAQWSLAGTPTDETRYGSAGQTLFLEVAAQRVACSHPLVPNMQCLQVREIQYDASGIKTRQGDWQAFYSDIEGYTHEPGVRNVLRVKRYERTRVPADASRYVYVLDMVVEGAREGSH